MIPEKYLKQPLHEFCKKDCEDFKKRVESIRKEINEDFLPEK
jgi:hypothetical protein